MGAILIDTQVLVWLAGDSRRLGAKARRLLENTNNDVALSYFSLLEIVLKAALGKMTYEDSIYEDLTAMGIRLLPANRSALKHYQIFNRANKDPFDNLLLAVAKAGGYQFITSDRVILKTVPAGIKLFDAQT